MIEIINSIAEFFTTVGEFIKYTITGTWWVIKYCIKSLSLVSNINTYFFPIGILATLSAFLIVAVLYKIFGRTS